MQALVEIGNSRGYGFPLSGHAIMTANTTNGAMVLTDNCGIRSITKTGTGLYTILLQDVLPAAFVHGDVMDPTATAVHRIQILTKNLTTRTITVVHQSPLGTAADIANGLEVNFLVYGRHTL